MAVSPYTVLVVSVAVREPPDLDQWSAQFYMCPQAVMASSTLDFLESAQIFSGIQRSLLLQPYPRLLSPPWRPRSDVLPTGKSNDLG